MTSCRETSTKVICHAPDAGDELPVKTVRLGKGVFIVTVTPVDEDAPREERLRGEIFTASLPAPASTAPDAPVNCPARSRIRNRKRPARSPRSIGRFGAC
jgi:hypothetical protein